MKTYRDENSNLEHVYLQNGKTSLAICSEYGAAISKFVLNGKTIISTPKKVNNPHTYASSILFPFANRIESGTYTYNGNTYNLNKNEITKTHAIHGLIYNKQFNIESYDLESEKASIVFSYTSKEDEFKGFPFCFRIQLKYSINYNKLLLDVTVKNLSSQTLPFSLGWHPYFFSESIVDRQLELETKSKLVNNKSMIPIGIKEENLTNISIDRDFDDCYKLINNNVVYKTDDYELKLSSNSKNNYLQIFTPNNPNLVAIEYMTAPPNCFNDCIDLMQLEPSKEFSTTWGIQLI